MLRSTLLHALRCVRGAVSTKSTAPAFSSVFFDGESATAYNGEIAVVSDCPLSGVKGGVDFAVLYAWADSCSGDELKWEVSGDELKLRCGRSSVRMRMLDYDQLTFVDEPDDDEVELPASGLCDALRNVAPYMGSDPAHPSRMGVTCVFWKKQSGGTRKVTLYATDDLSMARQEFDLPESPKVPGVVVLTPAFVHAVLQQGVQVPAVFIIGSTRAVATMEHDAGVARVYGRVGAEVDAAGYTRVEREVLDSCAAFVPISAKIKSAVNDVQPVFTKMAQAEVLLKVSDGKLTLSSGDGTSIKFKTSANAPDGLGECEVWVVARELQRVLEIAETFTISKHAVVAKAPNWMAMVSVAG